MRKWFSDIKQILHMVCKLDRTILPVCILCAAFQSAFPFVTAIFSARIVDCLVAGTDAMTDVWWFVGLNFAFAVISQLFASLRDINSDVVHYKQHNACNLKCLTMDFEQIETDEIIQLKTRAEEAENSGGSIEQFCISIENMLSNIFTFIYSCTLIGILFVPAEDEGLSSLAKAFNSPYLAIAFLALLVIIVLLQRPIYRRTARLQKEFYEINLDLNRKYQYLMLGVAFDYHFGKELRTFRLNELVALKLRAMRGPVLDLAVTLGNKESLNNALIAAIDVLITFAAYAFIGVKTYFGLISVGSVVLYVSTIGQFTSAIGSFVSLFSFIDRTRMYLKNYNEFLELPSAKYNGTLPVEKRDDGDYALEFKNVTFRYPSGGIKALDHVSIRLEIGKKYAVVGKNGAGKTTFIKLLCRLYDPSEGEITLNGVDIKKYDYAEYLSLFSAVFQDFKLFSTEIAENVAASKDYDEARVRECLEMAGMGERLKELPQDIHTPVYQNRSGGVEISGGEAQKIAIARALYKDAPVVILDEPTAALDPVSEAQIYEQFDALAKEKTALYISHRMSSCRFCENILVFDEGKIVAQGSHEELLQSCPLYAEMWSSQAQYYNEK